MSVFNKIKELTEDIENLGKDKAVVTITSDRAMLIENYNSIKLFTEDKLLLDFDGFDIYVCGEKLVIEFFSPSRIVVTGIIGSVTYMQDGECAPEEL
jgi:sporulation protein YqfC